MRLMRVILHDDNIIHKMIDDENYSNILIEVIWRV